MSGTHTLYGLGNLAYQQNMLAVGGFSLGPVVTTPQPPVHGWLADLPKPFVSEAGEIQNLVERPVGGVSRIKCKAGSRRSKHWHKTDWHYLYVLSGEMKYWERPAGSSRAPTYTLLREGDMMFTPPNVEHFTEFDVETLLISMHSLSRTHESHEADLVRVPWFE